MSPMAQAGEEGIGSMGNDSPLAVLSDKNKPLYNYFKQLFAQVTNPPIDPIREAIVMSLVSFIGPKPNLLDINAVNPPMRLEVPQPILDFEDMVRLRHIERHTHGKFKSYELNITYPAVWGDEGAEAVHPYLAMETLASLHKELPGDLSADKAIYNYVKAIGKGLSKIMSKMGVSTYMSYCGAQLFEAIGLEKDLVEKYFRGTASQIGGIGVFEVAEEAIRMHRAAFGADPVLTGMLDAGGEYAWRGRGEAHMWTRDALAKLQHIARAHEAETHDASART